jgi:DedD protein
MTATQDTEITLGTGKMLGLFFGLVVLCAVFFGMGYSLGRTSSKPTAAAEASAPASVLRPVNNRSSAPADSSKQSDLTFYKAVEQKDASPQLTPAEATSSAPEAKEESNKQPAAPDPATISGNSSYYVQVAAVSKQEDAESLVDALKKKQYAAFTANSAQNDKLFRVQVGPFNDIKDAEATRAKLISDGYNPILKK